MRTPMRLRSALVATLAALAAHAAPAAASMFQGETLDKVADVMAIVVLILVPVIAIVVFWLVHVLPERFAEKRHHPQTEAITTLCLLSLVFGGLLWPIAWLWAFTRPVSYKLAYGTDKHEDWYKEMGGKAKAGELTAQELGHLEGELEAMARRGALPPDLAALRDELARLPRERAAAPAAAGGAA